MSAFQRLFRLTVIGWLCLAPLLTASAQSVGSIYIHTGPFTQPVENGTALSFFMTFTILEPDGQVKTKAKIESASLLVGPDQYPVNPGGVPGSWSTVMLVDASQTLANAAVQETYATLRSIIANTLKKAPTDGKVSVLSFSDTTQILTPFINDVDQAGEAVRNIQATGGNACLFDGVYQAINHLTGTSGRRAVVIFTASKEGCFNRPPDQVVQFARDNDVQIYAVGLEGYTATLDELRALTEPTGGLANFKDEKTFIFGMENIITLLSEQWQVNAHLFPVAGTQTATLRLTLEDKSTIESRPIEFHSPKNFERPVQVALKGKVQSTSTGIQFFMDIVNRERIANLKVAIVDNNTGGEIFPARLNPTQFGESTSLPLPANTLKTGAEYTLKVQALDAQDSPLGNEAALEFQYQPPTASLSVAQAQAPTYDDPQVVVTLTQQNLGNAVKFKLWLMAAQDNAFVPETEQLIPAGEPLIIPIEPKELKTGKYRVAVEALAADGAVLAEARSGEITYTRPSDLDILIRELKKSPWAIAGLTGVCCLGVAVLFGLVWLMIPKPAAKPKVVDLALPEKRRAAPTLDEAIYSSGIRERPSVPQAQAQASAPPAVAAQPAASLTAIAPPEIKFVAHIHKTPFSVGRRDGNDAVLPVPNSSGVSGQHLTITYSGGAYYVQDNNSTYGTTLNGQPIAKGQPVRLENGAVLGLGPRVQVRFSLT